MDFSKEPFTIESQISLLERRGLYFRDRKAASHHLCNITFYRLRGYTYPFQGKEDPHNFTQDISFDDILNLYNFNRELRQIVFSAIEQIEVALRSNIINNWAISSGSHWYLNPALYRNILRFEADIDRLSGEIKRSLEDFINHYRKKYTNPELPPSWMSLEVASLRLLSSMFKNLKDGQEKEAVLNHFGLRKIDILESWVWSFANIRNICAHHGRLWNRRFLAEVIIPKDPSFLFLKK